MITSKKRFSVSRMVYLAILTALVIILQLTGIGIRLPFLATPISLVLIPIALGAMLLGPLAGAFLGFLFGMIVFITCAVMGMDPLFTGVLFANNPIMTALICIVKSTAAGFVAGWVYKLLRKFNSLLATFAAAAIVPILNTGLFVLGCLVISDTIAANFVAEGSTVIYFLIIGCAGINFIFEFLINIIFSPAIHRIMEVVSKRLKF